MLTEFLMKVFRTNSKYIRDERLRLSTFAVNI